MRTAIIHDWLTGMRGGERVLELFLELHPEAEIFTLLHIPGSVSRIIEERPIHSTWLSRVPGIERRYRWFLPLFPRLIESFDLSGFDQVISLSHCVALGVIPAPASRHVCYCFTPMRYAWDQRFVYFGEHFAGPLVRGLVHRQLHRLREWDVTASHRVDRFATTSGFVASRILRYYRRNARVIPPGVDLDWFRPQATKRQACYLVVSALSPYKRIERAIEACVRSARRLVVVGTGPERARLEGIGGSATAFVGWQSEEELLRHYRQARAVIFPAEEDFGLVPLEAAACGTPTIALGRGGALETVQDGVSGVLYEEDSVDSLMDAMDRFEALSWEPEAVREVARRFDRKDFTESIRAWASEAEADGPEGARGTEGDNRSE